MAASQGSVPPSLKRVAYGVEAVRWGSATHYHGGVLTVEAEEIERLFHHTALSGVRLSWASPGHAVRLVKVLDAVQPRTKGSGGAGIFPGFLCAPSRGGEETHVLHGVAVVAAGELPRAQEAVVDMSGPAAELSPLGATHNLVVEFVPAEGASWGAVDDALRRGLLATAARLAEAALEAEPDYVEHLRMLRSPFSHELPRVGVIVNLQTQGAFKNTFVYGRSFGDALPTLIDASELDDGAVVSGQYGHPGLKNPTYLHQNNPVVAALRERGGVDLSFAGLVLSPEPVDQASKELVSAHAARLCAAAGFDAAIVTKEGGGNADADVSLKMDMLEDAGIVAVGIFAEMAGRDGTGPSIVVPPERSGAMISTGNYDEVIDLPAMEQVLGGDRIALVDEPGTAAVSLPVAAIYCALSPLGWGHLMCRDAA